MNGVLAHGGVGTRARLEGWAWSLVLHGAAVYAALVLVADLRPIPPKEPFRWEISLVTPAPSAVEGSAVERSPAETPAPADTAQAEPPPVVQRIVQRPIETRQVEPAQPIKTVEVAQRPQERVVEPVPEPVERRVSEAARPVVEALPEARAREAVTQQVETAEPVEPARSSVTEAPVVARTEAPVQAKPVVEDLKPMATSAPVVAKIAPVTTAPAPVVAPPPAVVQSAQPIPREPVAPIASNVAPVETRSAPVSQPVPSQTQERSAPANSHSQTPPLVARAPRPDFGWLAQAMWQKVAALKRYPHLARLNHWEGRVVLLASIRDDGNLAELKVKESSGYEVLDEAALETVRKACPLELPHALGRPQVTIQIPISYSLR